jgi:putative toxin-antitoxin system antitoxin component (TIGR02293 family)
MGALELVERVKAGLPFKAMVRFQERTGLSAAAVADLIQVPLRTLNRRKTEGRFTPDESDRLLRAARIFGLALDLFEGRDQEARQWLERSQPALGGATPLSLAATEVGGREVEELIGRLEHGIPT